MVFCAKIKFGAVIAAVIALILTIVLCVGVASCPKSVYFRATFYYVCYDSPADAQSASSLSSAVQSYGGAGYIVKCDGKHYVTVACYYEYNDAYTVCSSLNKKELNCSVVKVKTPAYKLRGAGRKNAKLYEGNLNTLLSLSKVCYSLANSLENLTASQSAARGVLIDVGNGIEALERANGVNCFSEDLALLYAEYKDASGGIILARDVRRLQIAICNVITNAKVC